MVVRVVMEVTMPDGQHLPSIADDVRVGAAKALRVKTDDVCILDALPASWRPSKTQIEAYRRDR